MSNQSTGEAAAGGYSLGVSAGFERMARTAGVEGDLSVPRSRWEHPETTEQLLYAAVAGGGVVIRAQGASAPLEATTLADPQ